MKFNRFACVKLISISDVELLVCKNYATQKGRNIGRLFSVCPRSRAVFKTNTEAAQKLRNRGKGSVENQGVYLSK